jgi:pimeloyl-ACP methyl ester carboxylesterase
MSDEIRETPRRIGPAGGVVAITAAPTGPASPAAPAVVLMNPGTLHRVGVSRFNVRLARQLARRGHPSIRFDFSGLGDSEPREDGLTFRDSAVDEIGVAIDAVLDEFGERPVVLCGLCTGAAMSFEASVRDRRVVGVVLIEGYAYPTLEHRVRRWWPEVTSLDSWIGLASGRTFIRPALRRLASRLRGDDREHEARARSAVFAYDLPPRSYVESGLRELVARRVRMLHIFGGGAHHYYSYRNQFVEAFRSLDFQGCLEVEHMPDADHTFSALHHQRWLDQRILTWLDEEVVH